MKLRSCAAVFLRALPLALVVAAVSGVNADDDFPPKLAAQILELEPDAQLFIHSGGIFDYMPRRQLEHEADRRDPEGFARLVEEVLAVAAQMGYDARRDMGAIPLNLNSKRFNEHNVTTPKALRELEREPGPFSVHRYLFPTSGVPTFAGAPVAIWPEDLIAGKVDVAIVGIPNDMGSGRRNAEHGPRVMRALNTIGMPDTQSLVDPMQTLSVVDYGDFAVDNMSTERTIAHVELMVAETASTGAIPMLVGGDTSMLYPGVKGVARHHGEGEFGLLHISAHPDVDRHAVHSVSDEQVLFLLLDENVVRGEHTIQVGLRGPAVTKDSLAWLREKEVRYHTMAEIAEKGFAEVFKRVIKESQQGPQQLFLSVDVSVIEPSEMIGAGRLTSNGLRVAELSRAVRYLCAAQDIVGFEITDMAPMFDRSGLSTVNANALLNACLVGIAVRREGLGPEYVHPLAASHGRY
ncbi:MAG: arginase family protein [Pseudomonadota bacterium]